jgi:hypothetical protein
LALIAGCSAASCGSDRTGTLGPSGAVRQAVGEQQNGFPSPWERAVFMAANRARSDPSTVKGPSSTVYPAVKPLVLQYGLEQSARFHAINLTSADVTLMHDSPCTLNTDVATSGCTGLVSCACATPVPTMCAACANVGAVNNGCGTGAFTRIHYFYSAANAEVAAAGYGDPWSVMDGWVDEAAGADGHRTIIDSVGGDEGVAGFGNNSGTGACFSTFDVGDFGPSTTAPPMIASAAPKPISGSPGTFRIYATWNDPAGGAPAALNAVVDGACSAMTKELGDPKLNATYYADVPLTAGCHSVYIIGDSAGGTHAAYPTTTAFTIAVGSGACAEEVAQPPASCAGGTDAGAGDAAGDTGTGDTGPVDSGVADSGAADTAASDAGTADTGTADTGTADTGAADSGTLDAGVVDTGVVDTGVVDTGAVDTGVADTGGSDAIAADAAAEGSTGSDAASEEGGTGEGGLQDAAVEDGGGPGGEGGIDAATEDSGSDASVEDGSAEEASPGVDSAVNGDSAAPTRNEGGSLAPNDGGGGTWATDFNSASPGCECGVPHSTRPPGEWSALAGVALCLSLGLRRRRRADPSGGRTPMDAILRPACSSTPTAPAASCRRSPSPTCSEVAAIEAIPS